MLVKVHFFKNFPAFIDLRECQLIYFDQLISESYGELVSNLKKRPVLTISGPIHTNSDTILQLVKKKRKLRIQANVKAVEEAGLRLSAELLNIAIIVE